MNRTIFAIMFGGLTGGVAHAEDAICVGYQSIEGAVTIYEGSASSEIAGGDFSAQAVVASSGAVTLSAVSFNTVSFEGEDVTGDVDLTLNISGQIDDFSTGEMDWDGDITVDIDEDCSLTPMTGSWQPDSPMSSGDTFYFIDSSFGSNNDDVDASSGCGNLKGWKINNYLDDIDFSVVVSELDVTFSECTGASCYANNEWQSDGGSWTETRFCPYPTASTCQARACSCDDGTSTCSGWIVIDDL